MSEENKRIARRIPEEVFNQGKLDVIDEVIATGHVDHQGLPPGMPPGNEGFKAFVTAFRQAFPDLHYEVAIEVAEGDTVVQLMHVSGTMQGEFAGMPATGKRGEWDEIHIVRIAGGKGVEHWGVADRLGMLEKLGVMPQPAGAGAG